MKSRQLFQRVVMLVLCCLLVAGCSNAAKQEEKKNMSGSIKVLFGYEEHFYQKYGNLFTTNYPNIQIEVIEPGPEIYNAPDYNQALIDLIDLEKPDVIFVEPNSFEKFVYEGKLLELDSLIKRDKYNIDNVYPTLLELLKEQGGGKLYGLGPSFNSRAVYYNVDLFNKYSIEVPRDGMTWQEIFDLAKRFPTDGDEDTRVFGYANEYTMTVNQLVTSIADTQGLKYVNADTLKVTANTESWKKAYQLALDTMKSDAVYNPQPTEGNIDIQDYFNKQYFLTGRAAITTGYPYLLPVIEQGKSMLPDYKPFEIGIVAGPVDPADPDKTRDVQFSEIFAINANSGNIDAAWEFVKYVNGEDYAKVKSRTLENGLLSRMGYSTEFNGINIEGFYKLKPKLDQSSARADKIPVSFYNEFNPLVEAEIALVQEEKKSLDDALKTIEEQGQVLLDRAVKENAQDGNTGNQ